VTNRDIGFTMEIMTMQDMVTPMSDHLLKGDCSVMISPLWNKNEVKRLESLSAPWTNNDDLSQFRGAVVVANEKGQYTVPKAKGEGFHGWVAVVKDGVDIVKAAKQAKAQGATGLIIKTSEVLSMDKLARNAGTEAPELPAVYMENHIAEELNERCITLKGCEFKGKNRTAALRSIGRAGVQNRGDVDLQQMKAISANKTTDVFKNVGALMVEKAIEEAEEAERNPVGFGHEEEMEVEDEGSAGKGFQWKVAANTHYLWSTSGGGATRMNVNYGKKAPPTAIKKHRVNKETGQVATDASQGHVRTSITKIKKKIIIDAPARRSSVVSTALIDAEDMKGKNLNCFAEELGEVLNMEEAQNAAAQDQLPDDSDFKIEYNFEEIEVGVGETVEDIMEEEIIDDEGAVVGRFAVPVKRFWMVAGGMLISTMILSMSLLILLKTASPPGEGAVKSSADEDLDNPDSIGAVAAVSSFVARHSLWYVS